MLRVKKGTLVEVKAGKDAGKKGKVLRVYHARQRVLVQGVNMVKKHIKQRRQDMPSGIVEMESPVALSNVMPVCNRCGRGVRVGFKLLADKSKMKICKNCGEQI